MRGRRGNDHSNVYNSTNHHYLHHLVFLKTNQAISSLNPSHRTLIFTSPHLTAPLIFTSSITLSSSLLVTGPAKLHQPHPQGIPSSSPLPTSSTTPTSSYCKARKEDGLNEVGKHLVQLFNCICYTYVHVHVLCIHYSTSILLYV